MSSWTDYSQNRRIRELEESLDSARHQISYERGRMRSELSRLRGTLEQRLDRVSASLDAFIELSDIRATLAMFDDAAIARRRTLQMLDGVPLPDLELRDVPDYWLVPAARGLHALLSDDVGTARARFDEAARRDSDRARHFAALATALTRAEYARAMGESATAALLPHLPAPSEEVSRGRRALWLLTADGSFGEDAREHLLLATLRHWDRQGVRAPMVDGLFTHAVPASSRPTRSRSADPQGIAQRAAAARRITGLRESVSLIAALGGEDASQEVLAPDRASAEFLSRALRMLVEEGSAEEAPLIERAVALRAIIENGGEGGAQPRWDDTVGSVGALLGEDLTGQDAPTHRRTFALVLLRSAVLESAERLVEEASVPVEDSTAVTLQGVRVTVTSDGLRTEDLQQAEERLRTRGAVLQGPARSYMWGLLIASGVLLVVALASANGFAWFLCLAAVAGAGVALLFDRRERAAARADLEERSRRLAREAAQAAQEWGERLRAAEEHPVTARREMREIRRLLAS
ncbi:hypothetical protein [Nocardiopsis sp. ATB16-24]|uniref:hypothetical protein n=1 Tax=Nocardiopsis sp. ATB16-24 TaxID=3019555 RepID=UPI0025575513|nr:hypothetical protein [Nocardiopsis sp. ATB16-24]